jgi:endonuclease/exonuclease/phosphatase family metal-dependent hydrolase
MSRSFRLASYNIHRFIGRDGEYAPARTVLQIQQLQATVVALQEVHADDRQGMELLNRMARNNGYRLILGPTMVEASGHQYGNALLHPDNATQIRHHDLSRPGREPRGAIEARLELGGEPWRIFATHLGLSPGERRWQVRRLLQEMEADGDMNTILMGDLNEWFLWGRPLRWLKRYFHLSHQPPTFPARWPLLALDRIWVYPCQRLQSVHVVKTVLSRDASDHLPLLAEIGER